MGFQEESMTRTRALWRTALLIGLFVATTGPAFEGTDRRPGKETYNEPYRPQFHFSPARNWMNDPNGTIYYRGEYHLFYQYNPFGIDWGHMSWGHVVSPDMVHWKNMPSPLRKRTAS